MATVDLRVYLRRLLRQSPTLISADIQRSLATTGIVITAEELADEAERIGLTSPDDGVHWECSKHAVMDENDKLRKQLMLFMAASYDVVAALSAALENKTYDPKSQLDAYEAARVTAKDFLRS